MSFSIACGGKAKLFRFAASAANRSTKPEIVSTFASKRNYYACWGAMALSDRERRVRHVKSEFLAEV